ncbi:glutamate receptor 2-like [Aphidius gifuensis]|uniref:glutamate receptor 2-like n=1 Tax=Aphidius gifuensis TaxID=684658 RepID=UPI001CDD5678|nr:glutamate receptor 2-like [Aphidius gifuensis]
MRKSAKMILKIVNCKETYQLQPGDYKKLIINIYERYKYEVGGVVLAATFVNQKFEMLTFVHGITHTVSKNGIISSMVKIDNLEKRIIQYKHQGFRNPFVIIIIRSTNDVTKFIDITKNGKIKYPILLVIFTGDDSDYSCDIYDDDKILALPLVNITNENIIWNDTSVDKKKNLQGLNLRVSAVKNAKFIIHGRYKYSGFLGDVITELIEYLKFKISSFAVEDYCGSWDEDESMWSGVVGSVVSGESDLGIALVSMTIQRIDVVDFTLPIITTRSGMYIEKPVIGDTIQWFEYFRIFDEQVWITVIGIMLITSLSLTIIIYQPWRNTFCSVFFGNLLDIWGLFCQQGLSDIPKQFSIRISYFSVFITVSIVYATYSGCLTSFFTAPTITMPFNDMIEFSKQKEYELIMLKESADYDVFYESQDYLPNEVFDLIRSKTLLPTTLVEGFQTICNEKVAFYTTETYNEPRRNQIPCEIVQIKTGRIFNLGMILPRDSPYTEFFNILYVIKTPKYQLNSL